MFQSVEMALAFAALAGLSALAMGYLTACRVRDGVHLHKVRCEVLRIRAEYSRRGPEVEEYGDVDILPDSPDDALRARAA